MKNILVKLQPIISLIKSKKKFILILGALALGLFLLILFRGGSEVKLGTLDMTLPSFKKEVDDAFLNGPGILPNFLKNTEDDFVQSTNPDIVITEDLSDPDEYKRNGLEGSGEIVMITPNQDTSKIINEVANGKRTAAVAPEYILNKEISDQDALNEKIKLNNRIPVYINNFMTSNKMELNIVIHSFSYDSDHVLRIEILGIDFQNAAVSEKNPNMVAFREGFVRAKAELQSMGVDVKKLHIKFGSRGYIDTTASNWVLKLGLLN
ncbi:hypothetical protein HYV31_03500 [candidate division WWE3 bacterium]|nr:hypothetical protein [candidate division WWE3 bacterium]